MKLNTQRQIGAIGITGLIGDRKAKRGTSAAGAEARIRAYAQRQGWKLLKTYSPPAASREAADRRAAVLEAVAAACARRAVLVARRLSDLAGSTAGVLQICRQLRQAGADLAVIAEKIDTTRDGGFFFGLTAAFGKLDGTKRITPPPFGFTLADDGVHLAVDARQQAAIRQMVSWRSRGLSERAIVAKLKSGKVAGPAGKAWTAANIHTILAQAPTARWDGMEDLP